MFLKMHVSCCCTYMYSSLVRSQVISRHLRALVSSIYIYIYMYHTDVHTFILQYSVLFVAKNCQVSCLRQLRRVLLMPS